MKKLIQSWLFALCVPLLALSPLAVQAVPFSSLVIFGDSLSDSGNNAVFFDTQVAPPGTPPGTLRTPTPIESPGFIPTLPYQSNRYANGPVWVEQFAASLGLSAKASLLGGTNFAFGGATTGPAGGGFPFSLTDQVSSFLGATGGTASSDALYIVAGGGNDAREAFAMAAGGGDPTSLITAYAENVAAIITRLATAGADEILLVNTPDIGLTPALQALGPGAAGLGSGIAAAMNDALNAALASLLPALAIDVSVLNAYKLLGDVVADPGAFGLADASSACAFDPACIADPNGTFFWDGIHPTAAGHAAIARVALAMIPEPATWLLMALVMVFWLRNSVVRIRQ